MATGKEETVISTDKAKLAITNTSKDIADSFKNSHKHYKKKIKKSSDKLTKHIKKNHHFALQGAVLLIVSSLIVFSNAQGAKEQTVNYNTGFGSAMGDTTVDEVSSATVAKNIARDANLIVADSVANLADSLAVRVEFATTYDSYLAKPQIVDTNSKTRNDITEYTTEQGDTISKIAKKFNVTSDTIKWANDLYSDAIGAGIKLTIPPVSGVLHEVGANDTPQSLAQKYNANVSEIIAFNDAEVDGLPVGEQIVIPNGELTNFRQQFFSSQPAQTATSYYSSIQPLYGGNGYAYGYCTWHAAERRIQIGKPIPRNMGHAATWASVAARAGLLVNETPSAGAVLWHKNPQYIAGGYGHVGFVEKINPDGSIEVSDMNYQGWNVVSWRTITPSEFSQYLFIH